MNSRNAGSGPTTACANGPNPFGAVTAVDGVEVGSVQRIGDGWLTGTTVVMPPERSAVAVAVAGGAPATRETDALTPGRLAPGAHAIVLTGGSAYGLDSAGGVMSALEKRGTGFNAFGDDDPAHVVPIVPAAALFDLARGGDFSARPGAEFGRLATEAAAGGPVATGTVGAGTGALASRGSVKGGLGTAVVRSQGFTVGALVAVNAAGDIADDDGRLYAAAFTDRVEAPTDAESAAWRMSAATRRLHDRNTTIGVIATTAGLDAAETGRLAQAGHAGLSRAIRPTGTLVDGDTVFAVATGGRDVDDPVTDRVMLDGLAADAMMLAVADAVLTATVPDAAGLSKPRAYRDWFPSVSSG